MLKAELINSLKIEIYKTGVGLMLNEREIKALHGAIERGFDNVMDDIDAGLGLS